MLDDFAFSVVSETEIDGMYSVDVQNGPTLYISEDGKYFFVGDYYEVGEKGLINLGELESLKRVEALSNLNNEDMIIFGPENPKTYVYVFTDVDCYYCQKLHLEVPDLTESVLRFVIWLILEQSGLSCFKKWLQLGVATIPINL